MFPQAPLHCDRVSDALLLITLTVLLSTGQIFYKIFFSAACLLFFSRLDRNFGVWGRKTTEIQCHFSSYHIKNIQIISMTSPLTIYLGWVVFVEFLHNKIYLFFSLPMLYSLDRSHSEQLSYEVKESCLASLKGKIYINYSEIFFCYRFAYPPPFFYLFISI